MNTLIKSTNGMPFRIVGAYDAISAKLVEQSGFDGVWASGLCITAVQGMPDTNIMSFDTLVNVVSSMAEVINIPIIVDGDTGYGDFHNVIHLIRKLCKAGAAGLCIEDKIFPKINSYSTAHTQILEDPKIFASKIKAAIDTKTNQDFLVIARIEALIAGTGMDDALHRANLYMEAGADALVIHSKKECPDEIFDFLTLWNNRLPVIIIPTSYPTVTIEDMIQKKVSGVVFANQPLRAAVHAMKDYLHQLYYVNSLSSCTMPIATVGDIFSLQGMPEYQEHEDKYRDNSNK